VSENPAAAGVVETVNRRFKELFVFYLTVVSREKFCARMPQERRSPTRSTHSIPRFSSLSRHSRTIPQPARPLQRKTFFRFPIHPTLDC
jgi:hypothetical protein